MASSSGVPSSSTTSAPTPSTTSAPTSSTTSALLPAPRLGVTSGASSSERLFAGFYFVDASNAAQRLAQGMMREPLDFACHVQLAEDFSFAASSHPSDRTSLPPVESDVSSQARILTDALDPFLQHFTTAESHPGQKKHLQAVIEEGAKLDLLVGQVCQLPVLQQCRSQFRFKPSWRYIIRATVETDLFIKVAQACEKDLELLDNLYNDCRAFIHLQRGISDQSSRLIDDVRKGLNEVYGAVDLYLGIDSMGKYVLQKRLTVLWNQ
ncbi:unnamed protein product [Clonostachys rosea f. rosea IK726]|uniref:Uncharacterized protein n=1 Tax=Clonostachys rosea f. rosea IK726 TaxID=1349383 RepID=A0ACA9TWE5_BIOOC|nr:unnamed protein product [Clonostachys rosea f. rosea IK726]